MSQAVLDLLTSLLNNRKLLRLQSLLPVCLHCSVNNPQMPDLNGLWEAGGAGLVSISTPPSLPPWTVLFFWSFMCRGSGQLRCSKNILRGWWLFKPFFAPADRTGTVLGFQSFDRRLFPLNDLRRSACANEGNLRKSSHRKGAAEHRRGWRVAKTF